MHAERIRVMHIPGFSWVTWCSCGFRSWWPHLTPGDACDDGRLHLKFTHGINTRK
jgi:hypothetical protein